MEGTPYRSFFLEPTDTLHRQYEALRAVFVEQRPMQEAAQRFGYRYDTMRALVSRFRRQCETEQLPPFLPGRDGDGPPADSRANPRPPRKYPPRPIVVTSTSLRDDPCARRVAGIFLFLPLLARLRFDRLVAQAGYPGSQMVPAIAPCSACWH